MEEDELLIEAVRKFECHWKVRSRAYKDLRAKDNAWKAVATEISCESKLVLDLEWISLFWWVLLFRLVIQMHKYIRDTGRASEINMCMR